jgi:predicted dehydrogenase
MKSGRPVLTEKPLARTVADCHRMIDAAEKTGKLLMVAHCRRFDTDWGTWRKIFESGVLGAPVIWRHFHSGPIPGPAWFMDEKLSGGPLIDGAVHNYDFANLLFGEPESVSASSIKLTPHTAVDTATAVVRYKSGHQLMVSWCWGVNGGQRAMDVLGPNGSLVFGAGELLTPDLDTKKFGYYLFADPPREKKKLYKFERRDMYVTQARHFLDCVKGKTPCLAPATEAVKAVGVAEAILKAAPLGKTLAVKW